MRKLSSIQLLIALSVVTAALPARADTTFAVSQVAGAGHDFAHPENLSAELTAPPPPPSGFYSEGTGSVSDIFGPQVIISEKQELRSFNNAPLQPRRKKVDPIAEDQAEAMPQGQTQRFESREQIYAAFGDPTKRRPVLARPDAPGSMGGILACREIQDAECEKQYLKQHVDYLLELENRTKDVSLEIARAVDARKKGIAEEASETNPALFGKTPAQQGAAKVASTTSSTPVVIPESLRKRIPVDPKGEVDVLWFFDPKDAVAREQAAILQQLFQRSRTDKKISVNAMTIGELDREAVLDFRRSTQISFPIRSGFSLARGLGYTKSPTLVVMSRATGKSVDLQGAQDARIVQAILAVAQGRGK